jgi:hypothetical protein
MVFGTCFSIFYTYFWFKKKIIYSFSGILYEPFLLLDAPIYAHFAAVPAGVGEADDASLSGANEDVEDVAKFVTVPHPRRPPPPAPIPATATGRNSMPTTL